MAHLNFTKNYFKKSFAVILNTQNEWAEAVIYCQINTMGDNIRRHRRCFCQEINLIR